MADIHSTAVLTGDVDLATDVVVGPYCVLDGTCGPIRIGSGCRLVAQCYVTGPTTMGTGNTVWPGASLGTPPQDLGYDPLDGGAGLVIGNNNTFRELVTVHRSKTDDPTRIGNDNYFMSAAHVGHDSQIGNGVIMATGSMLGGHVTVEDKAILGGTSAFHQFVRIGTGALVAGHAGGSCDIPPWCTVSGINRIATQNIVGLRRSGISDDDIAAHRVVFRVMYRSRSTAPTIKSNLQSMADSGDHVAAQYLTFLNACTRPLCPGPGRTAARRSGR